MLKSTVNQTIQVNKVFLKDISRDKIIGYIAGYNYNKIDGYIYITSILEEQKDFNKESSKLRLSLFYIMKKDSKRWKE